jgi:hypothetical protein
MLSKGCTGTLTASLAMTHELLGAQKDEKAAGGGLFILSPGVLQKSAWLA